MTGVFASAALTPSKHGGSLGLVAEQGLGLLVVGVWAVGVTWLLLKFVGALTGGLRVDPETEYEGLDGTLHGERAYALGEGGGGHHAPGR